MMRRLLRIASTEILEQRRQPWMIFILIANYTLWILVFGLLFLVLALVTGVSDTSSLFQTQLEGFGMDLDAFLVLATTSFGSLMMTTLPLYVAIMSGTSVLHDRECGTMPFLMLAPVTRFQLLLGKLLGAMAIPLLLHVLLVGGSSLLLGRLDVLAPHAYKLGASLEWWIAFLVGGPASAAFIGALGTVISARSKDIRTSMQFTSFFVGLSSLLFGFVLVDGIAKGVTFQVAYALACLVAAALTLSVGAATISKDG